MGRHTIPLDRQARICACGERPCPSCLRDVLDLGPDGRMTWRVRSPETFTKTDRSRRMQEARRWNSRYAGTDAGKTTNRGYRVITLNGQRLLAHHVVWAMTYGEWPPQEIDHVNQDRADNAPANLRLADRTTNQWNKGPAPGKQIPLKGVYANGRGYMAVITARGRDRRYLGAFTCPVEAARAYDRAALELHGPFACTNASLGLLPEASA